MNEKIKINKYSAKLFEIILTQLCNIFTMHIKYLGLYKMCQELFWKKKKV